VRLFVRRLVDDGGGVERDEVGERADGDVAAVLQQQAAGGLAGALVDCGLERERLLLADVAAEHAREGTVAARVR
jgi:hypothetical protein